MLLQQNYGFWEPWQNPQKVTFDGDNKIIYINFGETVIDVKVDVYSAWKEWVMDPEHFNSKYLPAVRAVGGDPTVGGQFLGSTFFLTNGWRMKTWEGNHRLSVIGNLYTDEGEPTFIPTSGYSIIIESQVSSIATVAAAPEAAIPATAEEIADAVWSSSSVIVVPSTEEISTAIWDEQMSEHSELGTYGKRIKEILPTLWGL